MTAALQIWHRRPSRVHALELTHPYDLMRAERWLLDHHADVVRCHPADKDAVRFRQWPAKDWTVARLGHRLTRDEHTGEFAVQLEGTFLASHNRHDQTTDEGEAS